MSLSRGGFARMPALARGNSAQIKDSLLNENNTSAFLLKCEIKRSNSNVWTHRNFTIWHLCQIYVPRRGKCLILNREIFDGFGDGHVAWNLPLDSIQIKVEISFIITFQQFYRLKWDSLQCHLDKLYLKRISALSRRMSQCGFQFSVCLKFVANRVIS